MDEVLHKPAGRRPRQSDGRELSAQEQLGLLARGWSQIGSIFISGPGSMAAV